MRIAALTCTFGRPEAFALCQEYMKRQSRQPDEWMVLDGPEPMAEKVKYARTALAEYDAVAFIEDDDFYAPDWLEWCERQLERGFDIVGEGMAFYYHVGRRWWSSCENRRHASLCSTAIRTSLLEPMVNCIDALNNPFFDTRIWRVDCRKYLALPGVAPGHIRRVVGIKGMPGTKGYSAEHGDELPERVTEDPSLFKLFSVIGPDAANYARFKTI